MEETVSRTGAPPDPPTIISGDVLDSWTQEDILTLYGLFADTAEHTSKRRQSANSFYLTVNSVLLSTLGILKSIVTQPTYVLPTLASVGLLLCVSWWGVIDSYRLVNSAKFEVLHRIEELLPIRPFTGEWHLLSTGRRSLHRPLYTLERWTPVLFGGLYGLSFFL